ncbi:neutral zinc metalloprotease [Streptomyces corchorusii]|uniref:Neutral zinc metalloprotease n=1 Tax=Streptomyces corchorusii TaxID=1903 RepID=A0A101PZ00_STRCK|nr:neutral zinc metalloprotease [Streptomyces hygroscopicus subsp. jinggangensis 5008]AGF68228.1 neutral zinc metalloprotease [Streptomyces hygroscopicus subsp. jinggangensis TL01]KUN20260.1 neutral zinc metalloprotease [Streptomyces corchorusii]
MVIACQRTRGLRPATQYVEVCSPLRQGDHAQKTFDLSSLAGQTVTVKFNSVEDSSLQTGFVVDDTALTTS